MGWYIFDPLLTQSWEEDKRSCARSTAMVLGARTAAWQQTGQVVTWRLAASDGRGPSRARLVQE